jgi:hypothetical protein
MLPAWRAAAVGQHTQVLGRVTAEPQAALNGEYAVACRYRLHLPTVQLGCTASAAAERTVEILPGTHAALAWHLRHSVPKKSSAALRALSRRWPPADSASTGGQQKQRCVAIAALVSARQKIYSGRWADYWTPSQRARSYRFSSTSEAAP